MDRRSFLGNVGKLGAAGVALSALPVLESCSKDKKEENNVSGKARIGLIGPGSRGQLHLGNLQQMANAEVVALCDIYQPNLDKGLEMFPQAKSYTDYRDLLADKDVDGVVITTPLNRHYEMAMAAIAAGKNVYLEKAMAYTMDECLEIYNAATSYGKVFFVGQQRLFDPKYIKALDDVRNGVYGPVVNIRNYWFRNADWRRPVPTPEYEKLINWRLYRESSRGLMTELACHQLQNGIFATGELPCKVMGSGDIIYWKDGREVFDNVCVIYTFPSGVNMTFESVISNKHFGMGEQILCKEGTVDLPHGRYYPEVAPKKTAIRQMLSEIEKGVFSNPAFAGTSWAPETAEDTSGIAIMPEASGDGTFEAMQAFCNACITGEQPKDVLKQAYYASVLSLLGDEAMLQNKILDFPDKYKVD